MKLGKSCIYGAELGSTGRKLPDAGCEARRLHHFLDAAEMVCIFKIHANDNAPAEGRPTLERLAA